MKKFTIEVNNDRMNVTFLDGDGGTLQGADAAEVVGLLQQRFGGGSPVIGNEFVTQQPNAAPVLNGEIEPLLAPVLNFKEPAEPHGTTTHEGEIEPLVMPVMNFRKPERKAEAVAGVEPLPSAPSLFPAR